jgi:hypothetical protein
MSRLEDTDRDGRDADPGDERNASRAEDPNSGPAMSLIKPRRLERHEGALKPLVGYGKD